MPVSVGVSEPKDIQAQKPQGYSDHHAVLTKDEQEFPNSGTAKNIDKISLHWDRMSDMVSSSKGMPIILGGDHSIETGILRGLAKKHGEAPGVVWIDAHSDLNSPNASPSGNVHGMPLWFALREGTFNPNKSVFVGVRCPYCHEANDLIKKLQIPIISKEEIADHGVNETVKQITQRVGENPHVSFDIDALDPIYAPGTGTPLPDGLDPDTTFDLIRQLKPSSFTLAEVDPQLDKDGITIKNAIESIHASTRDNEHVDIICAPMNLGQEHPGPAEAPSAILNSGLVNQLLARGISSVIKNVEV